MLKAELKKFQSEAEKVTKGENFSFFWSKSLSSDVRGTVDAKSHLRRTHPGPNAARHLNPTQDTTLSPPEQRGTTPKVRRRLMRKPKQNPKGGKGGLRARYRRLYPFPSLPDDCAGRYK